MNREEKLLLLLLLKLYILLQNYSFYVHWVYVESFKFKTRIRNTGEEYLPKNYSLQKKKSVLGDWQEHFQKTLNELDNMSIISGIYVQISNSWVWQISAKIRWASKNLQSISIFFRFTPTLSYSVVTLARQ